MLYMDLQVDPLGAVLPSLRAARGFEEDGFFWGFGVSLGV